MWRKVTERMATIESHPAFGKEVMAMDDADVEVDVCITPVDSTSRAKGRMNTHE